MDKAREAASNIFATLEREVKIDSMDEGGQRLRDVRGEIRLQEVSFSYASRPNTRVLSHVSCEVPAGTSCALVGPSGSGKSTVAALVERFYDPGQGAVLLDGVDIRTLNVKWYRDQIGLVPQEPTLFATSILDNLRYGSPGATREQVQKACKAASIHEHIMGLPDGYDTFVGERGAQLSGGQVQRIAVARALLKAPRVLILDEATSALGKSRPLHVGLVGCRSVSWSGTTAGTEPTAGHHVQMLHLKPRCKRPSLWQSKVACAPILVP